MRIFTIRDALNEILNGVLTEFEFKKAIQNKELPCAKAKGKYLIRESDLLDWKQHKSISENLPINLPTKVCKNDQ